jgi:hypothetical protein
MKNYNSKLKIPIVILSIFLGLFCFAKISQAATYYVSTTGNDSNPGTQAQPWLTIQKAADTMVAGDTVNVNAGNYGGDASVYQKVRITKSGSSRQQITYWALGTVLTQGFLVSADYITIKGFDVEDPHDDRIKNSTEPDYRGGTGIFVEGSYNIIEDNYIHGCVWSGIKLSKNDNFLLPSNVIVRNNRLFRNGMSGIEVSGRNNLIEGNEIWATIQHHPGNILSATATWLDADGIRFFGQGHIFRKNYIHDIKYGLPGVNLDPNDPNNIYNMLNDYNNDPHIDCFQTWAGTYTETASNIIFEQNRCDLLVSQASAENGHAFMLAGGANNIYIMNNIFKAYGGINTGGTGNANYLYVYNNIWINNLSFKNFWPHAIGLQNVPYAVVKNNIFYNQPYHTIFSTGTVTNQDVDYNLAYNSDGSTPDCFRVVNFACKSPVPAHDLWKVDPKFIDSNTDNYHLQSTSPAINVGAVISSVTNDYDGNSRPQGSAYDIGVFEYVDQVTPPADITPPTISSVVSSPTHNSATIIWTTNESSDSQVEYGLTTSYGSQTTLNTSMATAHSVLLSNLNASTVYHYRVKSKDAANNLATSSDYTFTTSTAPTLSVSLTANPASGETPLNGVDLTATVTGNVVGTINYTFYCNRTDSGTNITTPYAAKYDGVSQTTRTGTDICSYSTAGTYTAKVIVERGGYQAEARTTITVSQQNYAPIGNVDRADTNHITGWAYDQNVGTSPINVHIYIDNQPIANITANLSRPDIIGAGSGAVQDANHGFDYAFTNLSVGNHTINVYAINTPEGTNPELPGSPKTVTIQPPSDTNSPSIPTNLTATAVSSSQINLSWTASTDNVGVTGYRIYRGGTQITTSTTNSYQNTGLSSSTTYTYTVAAYDAANNVSNQSNSASATTQAVADITPPTAPTGVKVN